MHLQTMPGLFFKRHFFCRPVQKVSCPLAHSAVGTKEQLMRNCCCIIAEHAAGAAAGHKEAINAAQMRLACIKMLSPHLAALQKVHKKEV